MVFKLKSGLFIYRFLGLDRKKSNDGFYVKVRSVYLRAFRSRPKKTEAGADLNSAI